MNFKEGFSMTAGKQSCCLAQCQTRVSELRTKEVQNPTDGRKTGRVKEVDSDDNGQAVSP